MGVNTSGADAILDPSSSSATIWRLTAVDEAVVDSDPIASAQLEITSLSYRGSSLNQDRVAGDDEIDLGAPHASYDQIRLKRITGRPRLEEGAQ